MNDKIIITAEDRGIVIVSPDGDIVEPPEADIIKLTPKFYRIERRKRLKYKIKKFFSELIRKIKYRFRKTFNIKNDIPKLMKQVRLEPENSDEERILAFGGCPGDYTLVFADEVEEPGKLEYEVGVDKNEAIRRLKERKPAN